MERLRKAEAVLKRLEGGVLVALLSVMVCLSFAQVLLRQFLGTGLLWADTLARHLVLWVGFLGAALAAAENKHFAWEAAAHQGGRLGAALALLSRLAAACIAALLTRASWLFLLDEKAQGSALFTMGSWEAPAWAFSAIIPAGFALILLHTLVSAADAFLTLRRGKAKA